MTTRQTSNPVVTTPQEQIESLISNKFSSFALSLGEALNDITALEVNTMIVSQITGNKFVAELAYRGLYDIPASEDDTHYETRYFEAQEPPIPQALHLRYLNLRRRLVSSFLAIASSGKLYGMDGDFQDLPHPDRHEREVAILLKNGQFLRTLRKLAELKAALDLNVKQSFQQGTKQPSVVDIIYAQTVLQLDGDVINRFHENLLKVDSKDVLLHIHNQGVSAGERQWRGLLQFMVGLVQEILFSKSGSKMNLKNGADALVYPRNYSSHN